MTHDEWWRRFIGVLRELPFTGDDDEALVALLRVAGYYDAQPSIERPAFLCPERHARSSWRLTYLAPPEARNRPDDPRFFEVVLGKDLVDGGKTSRHARVWDVRELS